MNEYATKASDHMHKFYGSRLRPSLAAVIERVVADTPLVEQLSCVEELQLLRVQAGDAVAMYGECVEQGATGGALLTAGAVMAESLERVVAAAKTVASVEELKLRVAGTYAAAMHQVIVAVVRAANVAFENDYRVARFEEMLREELDARVGADAAAAVPPPWELSADVGAMDESVPAAPAPVETTAGDAT